MTDNEPRGKLLQELYDRRQEDMIMIGLDNRHDPEAKEQVRIAHQLAEHGLIKFKLLNPHIGGNAKITAHGVDVIEGTPQSDISIQVDRRQTINISGSSDFQIGDHNSKTINTGIQTLIETINSAEATPKEKDEAKLLLRQFLEHPLVTSIAGSAIRLLGS